MKRQNLSETHTNEHRDKLLVRWQREQRVNCVAHVLKPYKLHRGVQLLSADLYMQMGTWKHCEHPSGGMRSQMAGLLHLTVGWQLLRT